MWVSAQSGRVFRAWLFAATLCSLMGVGFSQQQIVIGTGGVGGVFFYYGTTLAEVLSKNGIPTQAIQTGGSIDNILLIEQRTDVSRGVFYCGFTQSDTAFAALMGEHPRFRDQPAKNLRVLFAAYPVYFHIVTREDSGIKSIHDLRGRRVSTGAPGSGIEYESLLVLEAAGIKVSQLAKQERLGAEESAQALAAKHIDAFFWTSGLPAASLVQLANSLTRQGTRMHLIPLDSKSTPVQVFLKRYPGLAETAMIPKEAYGLKNNTPTLAFVAFVVCHKDLPEGLATRVLRILYENVNYLQGAVPAAKDTSPSYGAKFVGGNVPYHPGSIRFFREAGYLR